MKLGVVLPQHDVACEALLDAAKLAEASGLDSVWLIDHLMGRPEPARRVLECWTALSAVGAATSAVTIGTLVLRVGLRKPRVLAAMASTLSKICSNRLILGLGIGDRTVENEQAVFGIAFKDKAGRLKDLDETLETLRVHVPGVALWVGGGSAELMDRAATVQGWNWWGRAKDMKERLDLFRSTTSADVEVSWAGMWPGIEALDRLAEIGVNHAIVATGVNNYKERIAALAAFVYPPGV